MWAEDCKINVYNLDATASNIPLLHAKYHRFWMEAQSALITQIKARDLLERSLFDYYQRYITKPEDLKVIDKDQPWQVKSSFTESKYLVTTDAGFINACTSVEKLKLKVKVLEDIVSAILKRDYTIRNILEVRKLDKGYL